MKPKVRNITSLLGLIFYANAGAVSLPKWPTSNFPNENQALLLHKVAVLGSDGRQAHNPGYLPRQFSGSGRIVCERMDNPGGAQLTVTNNVITTASHVIFDKNTCRKRTGCKFKPDGVNRWFKIDMSSVHGSCINLTPNKKNPIIDSANDWAVMKLEKSVDGVAPYGITDTPVVLKGGELTTLVTVYDTSRMSTQVCKFQYPNYSKYIRIMHNCDTEPFSSGGGHIDQHNRLLAIHIGGRSGDADGVTYNASVPLDGKFYQALIELTRPESAQLEQ